MRGRGTNNFTGDVIVHGGSTLSLQKSGGAITIQRDISIRDNSFVFIDISSQMPKSSTVTIATILL